VNLPEIEEEYKNQTYRDGREFGIDTAHGFNLKMTNHEKLIDAVRQIQELIEDYESRRTTD
ncbi:MAG: hypothetical protein WA144_15360, partial [Candidatus Methanoperedens sp.]